MDAAPVRGRVFRIHRIAAGSLDNEVFSLSQLNIRAETESLFQPVSRFIFHIAYGFIVKRYGSGFFHAGQVLAAPHAAAYAVVADKLDIPPLTAGIFVGRAVEEPTVRHGVYSFSPCPLRRQYSGVLHFCPGRGLCRRFFRRGGTELHIHAQTVESVLIGPVVVAIVEEVVDAYVRRKVFTELFLDHKIPNTEGFAAVVRVLFFPFSRIGIKIGGRIGIGNRIAVQHVNIVISPESRLPAVLFIFIVQADIHFMLRPVQKLSRHVGIALIDGMEPGVSQLGRPAAVKAVLHFRFDARDFSLADILKRIQPIQTQGTVRIQIRTEVNKLSDKIRRHIVINDIVKDGSPGKSLLIFSFNAYIEIQRFLRFQIRIAHPVPAVMAAAGGTVHFPVIIEFTQSRLGVARPDIGLQTAVRVAAQVAGHAELCRKAAAEFIAVIEAQDRSKYRIVIDLPCILDKKVTFPQVRFTAAKHIFAGVIVFLKIRSVILKVPTLFWRKRCGNITATVVNIDNIPVVCIIPRIQIIQYLGKGLMLCSRRKQAVVLGLCDGAVMQCLLQCVLIGAGRKISPPFILFNRVGREGHSVMRQSGTGPFLIFFIRKRRRRFAVVVFQIAIPLENAVGSVRKRIVMNTRIGFAGFSALFNRDIKIPFIVPGIDGAYPALGRIFQTCTVSLFFRIAEAVGKKVPAVRRIVQDGINAELLMLQPVQRHQAVLPRISVAPFIVISCNARITFLHFAVVHIEFPIRLAAAACIGQAVRIPIHGAFENLHGFKV